MEIEFARMHGRGGVVCWRMNEAFRGELASAARRIVRPEDFNDSLVGTEWRTSAATMGATELAFNVPGGLVRAAVRGAGLREGGGA